jgi:hypothetical protein
VARIGVKIARFGVAMTRIGVKMTRIGVKMTRIGVKMTRIGLRYEVVPRDAPLERVPRESKPLLAVPAATRFDRRQAAFLVPAKLSRRYAPIAWRFASKRRSHGVKWVKMALTWR